mgnify:FL=1
MARPLGSFMFLKAVSHVRASAVELFLFYVKIVTSRRKNYFI